MAVNRDTFSRGRATGCSPTRSWRSTATGCRAAAASAELRLSIPLPCRRRRDGRCRKSIESESFETKSVLQIDARRDGAELGCHAGHRLETGIHQFQCFTHGRGVENLDVQSIDRHGSDARYSAIDGGRRGVIEVDSASSRCNRAENILWCSREHRWHRRRRAGSCRQRWSHRGSIAWT